MTSISESARNPAVQYLIDPANSHIPTYLEMATKASITVSVLFILTAALSSDTLAEKLEVKKVYLEAFQAVQICAPLSILVVPTYAKADDDKGLYSLKIEGEASVHQSIQGRVQDGILYVEANESFQIHANAKLTVSSQSYQPIASRHRKKLNCF